MLRRRFKTGRFPRLVIVLLAVCLPAVGGAVYSARSEAQNSTACLVTLRSGQPYKLFDLNTGLRALYRAHVEPSNGLSLRVQSPDGKHVAYLKPLSPGSTTYALLVDDIASGKTTVVLDRAGELGDDSMGVNYNLVWSPDSSQFAYLWSTGQRSSSFVVGARADGSNVQRQDGAASIEGWSRDSAFLAYVRWSETPNDGSPLFLWSLAFKKVTTLSLAGYRSLSAVWSPTGNQIAYLEIPPASTTQPNAYLTVIEPGKGLQARYAIQPLIQNAVEVQTPSWSPDGRYVALGYKDWRSNDRLDVYGVDGTAFPAIATQMPFVRWQWSDDSHSLMFIQTEPNNSVDLMTFHIDEQRSEIIASDLLAMPSGYRLWLVAWQHNGKHNVDLVSADGKTRIALVAGADDVGKTAWALDGGAVYVVWSSGQGAAKRAHLTGSRIDGSARYTVDAVQGIRDLTWLRGSAALSYVAEANGRATAGLIDTKTGTIRPLLENRASITAIREGAPVNQSMFYWKGDDGSEWMDSFDLTGKRTLHFQATRVLYDRAFISPDGRMAALLTATEPNTGNSGSTPGYVGLRLSSADGTHSRTIRSGLLQISEVYWSLDGKMLAFTQIAQNGVWTLEVITADGAQVQSFQGTSALPERDEQLRWTECG